jgi:hypothetical protein
MDGFRKALAETEIRFPGDVEDIVIAESERRLADFPTLMNDVAKYLRGISQRGPKPNVEANLSARLARVGKKAGQLHLKGDLPFSRGKVSALFPTHGIQHNHVNRLLLMSSSEHHTRTVPMAFFINRPPTQSKGDQSAILADRPKSRT